MYVRPFLIWGRPVGGEGHQVRTAFLEPDHSDVEL